MTQNWLNSQTQELFRAILQLQTESEVAAFCRDLMTESEIIEFANRWQVAKLLDEGRTQRDIAAQTKVSLATVTRVNQWLNRGMGGYRLVLNRLHRLHSINSADAGAV